MFPYRSLGICTNLMDQWFHRTLTCYLLCYHGRRPFYIYPDVVIATVGYGIYIYLYPLLRNRIWECSYFVSIVDSME